MRKTNLCRFIKTFSIAIGVGLFSTIYVDAESLAAILKSPGSYNHRRVSLVGVLRGQGPVFELFETPADALSMKPSRGIHLIASAKWRKAGPYDLRRARVAGVVDANWHGVWGNPCAMSLDTVEVLSGPVAPWPDVVAVFRNERTRPVWLHFGTPPTDTDFMVRPKECIDVNIQNTTVRVFSPKATLLIEAQILKRPAMPYYDSANAASYYRITDNRVETVLPSVAMEWNWRR
jgi:hypothetical protein